MMTQVLGSLPSKWEICIEFLDLWCLPCLMSLFGAWTSKCKSLLSPHLDDLFFLKIYFYYVFIGKADIQRAETERKMFHPMIHSPSERNSQ